MLSRLTRANPALRGFAWDDAVAAQPSEDADARALSLRSSAVGGELVLRGEKTIEARSIRTNIRERVHIYASLGDVDTEDQTRVRREYGLNIESLPRGVLVGTVVVVGCRPLTVRDSRAAAFPVSRDTELFAWLLESPERAERLVKPAKHPQPVWFTPF